MSSIVSSEVPVRRRTVAASALVYLVLWALLWLLLYGAYQQFPYIRPGSDLVAEMKIDKMARARLFDGSEKYRVVVFGNSRTLAGFRPEVFDAAFHGSVRSWNFGIPGERDFFPALKAVLENGNRPTHILLQLPWTDEPIGKTWSEKLKDDKTILKQIVPFRSLPRDAFIFLFSGLKTGVAKEYRRMISELSLAEQDRGWYFIRSQSHYPNDQLPADFSLPTDNPELKVSRSAEPVGAQYQELVGLADKYGFQVILIPDMIRIGERKVSTDATPRTVSATPSIRSVGPDYLAYPATNFSDTVHLNPKGATIYTDRLAEILLAAGVLR